jgi:predicted RNase H-like HicB family nuclease
MAPAVVVSAVTPSVGPRTCHPEELRSRRATKGPPSPGEDPGQAVFDRRDPKRDTGTGVSQNMRNEFTAVVEQDGEWFIAYSPEIPGANGQGKTKGEALSEAIALILEDRREEGLRGVPAGAIRETVTVQ